MLLTCKLAHGKHSALNMEAQLRRSIYENDELWGLWQEAAEEWAEDNYGDEARALQAGMAQLDADWRQLCHDLARELPAYEWSDYDAMADYLIDIMTDWPIGVGHDLTAERVLRRTGRELSPEMAAQIDAWGAQFRKVAGDACEIAKCLQPGYFKHIHGNCSAQYALAAQEWLYDMLNVDNTWTPSETLAQTLLEEIAETYDPGDDA